MLPSRASARPDSRTIALGQLVEHAAQLDDDELGFLTAFVATVINRQRERRVGL